MEQSESLIGREAERRELEQSVTSGRSELVIVYGRRRIGKTYLIEQHFKHTFDLLCRPAVGNRRSILRRSNSSKKSGYIYCYWRLNR